MSCVWGTIMGERESEETRLCILLKRAADHLESEARSLPRYRARILDRAQILECRTKIEECRLRAEPGPIGEDLWWELWSIFGRSLDWDHLASDYKLGDEILRIIERFDFKDHKV